ncbi:unnamed protein product [Phytomonas sp. Hart1]|nr:unnamed protein product [Phytomonas sp. Hart1]|eukprot:CCW69011.1 unnamed protein product [Phytomonas sp. isolate Hart1]
MTFTEGPTGVPPEGNNRQPDVTEQRHGWLSISDKLCYGYAWVKRARSSVCFTPLNVPGCIDGYGHKFALPHSQAAEKQWGRGLCVNGPETRRRTDSGRSM